MIKIKNGPLYQWDLNRIVEISDPENKLFEVECYPDDAEDAVLLSFLRKGDKAEVFFPNLFLQNTQNVHIMAVFKENEEVRTAEHRIFNVRSRIKPSDYIYEETEILKYKNLETELRKALENKADLDENGKIKAEQLPAFSGTGDVNLTDVINEALAAAKESGDFKGEDGTSVEVESISESAQDGGYNFVYFSDGTSVKIRNGSKGSDGEKGADGTTIKVDTVSESANDGGNNFVYFSDGTTLKIKNGSRGSDGAKGADGYTPIKGVDYFTAADKAEIAQMIIESFGGNPVVGYVDENNNILVKGNLEDGMYTVKYEMENGSKLNIGNLVIDTNVYYSVTNNLTYCTSSNSAKQATEGKSYSATISANSGYELKSVVVRMGGTDISASAVSGGSINIVNVTGNIVITAVAEVAGPAYTNQIPISIGTDKKAFVGTNGEKGYKTGFRLSLSGGGESAQDGTEVTGFIPVTKNSVIRIKNIAYSGDTTRGVVGYDANFTKLSTGNGMPINTMFVDNGFDDGNGVRRSNALNYYTHFNSDSLAYIRLCSTEITDNSIITVNQEIV